MVAFARPALGCAHTVGFTDVFIARDGHPRTKKVKLINHDCLPILMLLYIMLYIVLAYLMLFAALTNYVCLNNASLFFSSFFF